MNWPESSKSPDPMVSQDFSQGDMPHTSAPGVAFALPYTFARCLDRDLLQFLWTCPPPGWAKLVVAWCAERTRIFNTRCRWLLFKRSSSFIKRIQSGYHQMRSRAWKAALCCQEPGVFHQSNFCFSPGPRHVGSRTNSSSMFGTATLYQALPPFTFYTQRGSWGSPWRRELWKVGQP